MWQVQKVRELAPVQLKSLRKSHYLRLNCGCRVITSPASSSQIILSPSLAMAPICLCFLPLHLGTTIPRVRQLGTCRECSARRLGLQASTPSPLSGVQNPRFEPPSASAASAGRSRHARTSSLPAHPPDRKSVV